MIDIIVMLFTIIRSYFPSELRWTAVLTVRSGFVLISKTPAVAGCQHASGCSNLLMQLCEQCVAA